MRQKQPEMVQMKCDDPLKGARKPKNSFDLPWNHRSSYYRTELRGHLGNIGYLQFGSLGGGNIPFPPSRGGMEGLQGRHGWQWFPTIVF